MDKEFSNSALPISETFIKNKSIRNSIRATLPTVLFTTALI